MIDKQKNVTYKALARLFGNENAESLLGISDYIKKHNINGYKEGEGVIVLDSELIQATNDEIHANTIKKPRELSQATKEKRFNEKLAKLKEKYGITDEVKDGE